MIAKMAMPELLAIFDHAPVGIVFVREGMLQHCNRRFCELLGYGEDEVFGQRARVLYESTAEYERLRSWAREALLAGDPFDAEIPMRRRDGSLLYCRLHAAAVDRDNPREGTVWIVEDLEEQTRIRDELWHTQRDLEATFAAANVGIALIRERRIVRHPFNVRRLRRQGHGGDGPSGRCPQRRRRRRHPVARLRVRRGAF